MPPRQLGRSQLRARGSDKTRILSVGGRPLAKEVACLDLLLQVEVCRIGHERRRAGVAAAGRAMEPKRPRAGRTAGEVEDDRAAVQRSCFPLHRRRRRRHRRRGRRRHCRSRRCRCGCQASLAKRSSGTRISTDGYDSDDDDDEGQRRRRTTCRCGCQASLAKRSSGTRISTDGYDNDDDEGQRRRRSTATVSITGRFS